MTLKYMGCCGVREIAGLSGFRGRPTAAMQAFCKDGFYDNAFRCSHVVFTEADNSEQRYGLSFATFITRNKLGHVAVSLKAKNPNSPNRITVWVWTLDTKALRAWWALHRPKPRRPRRI